MGIAIKGFIGQQPRIAPLLLPDNAATIAQNVYFILGTLKPMKAPLTIYSDPFAAAAVKNLYISESGRVVGFLEDVYWVKEATEGYDEEWLYITNFTGKPPLRASIKDFITWLGVNMYGVLVAGGMTNLGVPAPTYAITGYVEGTSTNENFVRRYVWTWVTEYGEESAPSPPSDTFEFRYDQWVVLSLAGTVEAPVNVDKVRIYRTDVIGNYRFLMEVAIGVTYIEDHVDDVFLGEVLATTGWIPPPSNLSGIKSGPNGVFAGFFGQTICFSVPYAPYAWPIDYQFNVDWPIVAIQANSGGWLILTTGYPYFIYGSDPADMQMSKINSNQACIAPKSVVDMGDYIIYAAPNGLVAAKGMDVKLISDACITPEQWQDSVSATLRGYAWQGRYMGFLANGTGNSFIYDQNQNFFVSYTISATACIEHLKTGNLYIYDSSRKNYEQWGSGATMTQTWRSKRFSFPQQINLGAAMVDAFGWPVTLNLFKDDEATPFFTISVTSKTPFKLPAGYLANSFYVEIVGTNEVFALYFGQSIDDLVGQA